MARTVKFRIEGSIVLEDDEDDPIKTDDEVHRWLCNDVGVIALTEVCEGLPNDGISLISVE